MKKTLAVAVLLVVGLIGCAVVPVGTYRSTTVQTVVEECDYTTDECTQVEVAAYPGVIFHSRYIAECFCIWPVAFYGGTWINYLGSPIVYHGYWGHPPRNTINSYRGFARGNTHMFTHVPPRGRPNGSFGGRPQQHSVPQQHVVPQQRPQMHVPPPQQRPQVQRPIPQARPQMQQRAPQSRPQQQRAPARSNQQSR